MKVGRHGAGMIKVAAPQRFLMFLWNFPFQTATLRPEGRN